MPLAAKITLALFVGGVVGYIVSRLIARDSSTSLASNRALMSVFGAILAVVAVTVVFRASPAVAALTSVGDFNKKVVRAEKPVVVDFYADWCPPCRQMKPILDNLAGEYAGKIVFYKVDVVEAPGLAAAHGVRGIPMFLFYRDGRMVGRLVGGMPEAVLRQALDGLLDGW